MTNEAFSRVKIDARLRDQGWEIALIQSLIAKCRLHDIDPNTYLVDVLQRVGQHPAARLGELTPRQRKTRFADNPLRSDSLTDDLGGPSTTTAKLLPA